MRGDGARRGREEGRLGRRKGESKKGREGEREEGREADREGGRQRV